MASSEDWLRPGNPRIKRRRKELGHDFARSNRTATSEVWLRFEIPASGAAERTLHSALARTNRRPVLKAWLRLEISRIKRYQKNLGTILHERTSFPPPRTSYLLKFPEPSAAERTLHSAFARTNPMASSEDWLRPDILPIK